MKIVSVKDNQAEISGDFVVKFIGDLTKEEWRLGRKDYLGGSESFSLVSNDYKWDTPYTLYCKKSLGVDLTKVNADMMRGIERESQILQEFRESGHTVYTVPYLLIDKVHEFLAANIDGIEEENNEVFGIEIKSVRSFSAWKEGVPENYYNQCQHYMMILGTKKHRVIADCNGKKKVVDISRDNDYIYNLKKKCVEFWTKNIMKDTAPEPLYLSIEKDYIDYLNKDFCEDIIEVQDKDEIIKRYIELGEKEKEIKEERDSLNLKIKFLIGRNRGALFGNIKASYIRLEKDSFDVEKFKEDYPNIYSNYIKKSSYSQLRVKEESSEIS